MSRISKPAQYTVRLGRLEDFLQVQPYEVATLLNYLKKGWHVKFHDLFFQGAQYADIPAMEESLRDLRANPKRGFWISLVPMHAVSRGCDPLLYHDLLRLYLRAANTGSQADKLRATLIKVFEHHVKVLKELGDKEPARVYCYHDCPENLQPLLSKQLSEKLPVMP